MNKIILGFNDLTDLMYEAICYHEIFHDEYSDTIKALVDKTMPESKQQFLKKYGYRYTEEEDIQELAVIQSEIMAKELNKLFNEIIIEEKKDIDEPLLIDWAVCYGLKNDVKRVLFPDVSCLPY